MNPRSCAATARNSSGAASSSASAPRLLERSPWPRNVSRERSSRSRCGGSWGTRWSGRSGNPAVAACDVERALMPWVVFSQ